MTSIHTPHLLTRTLYRAARVLPLALLLLLLAAGGAQATSITAAASSSGGGWVGAVWTPSSANSVVSASELQGLLATGDVTIQSFSSDGALTVQAPLTLTSHVLQLESRGDIAFQAVVDGRSGGKLTLLYGQAAIAAGNTATILASAPVHLVTGSQYKTKLGSDGAEVAHTIITGLGLQGSTTGTDLQGMQRNPAGRYVLGADIDARATSGWNAGAGFNPVGPGVGPFFTGSLDGLGHTIEGLTINRPGTYEVGLFGFVFQARLSNIGLVNGSIRGGGRTGALAGNLHESIVNSSYATGDVGADNGAGGLVGSCVADCTINSSYATGNVSASAAAAGGLVGACWADCTINSSYATGIVSSADSYAGGLVGDCESHCTISRSYATGDVSAANSYVGGLAGNCLQCTISSSYATGNVTAAGSFAGGLASECFVCTISNSYATGSVTAASSYTGGLVGTCLANCTIGNSFYATTASGAIPINNGGVGGNPWQGNALGTAKTLAELNTLATFTAAGWAIDDAGATGTTWRIYDGQTTPLLRGLLTALTITNPASKPADGTRAVALSYSSASPDAARLGSATAQASSSAVGGPYPVTIDTSGLLYHQRGYDITLAPQAVTITAVVADPGPATLPVAGPGSVVTITDPGLPIVVGPGAGGATLVLPGTGTTPVNLQVTINGQPLQVQATPGSYLRIAQVDGQSVLVLVVIQGWASMTSSAAGQPMALAGDVLLSAGSANTTIEAQPLTVAVLAGSLAPPAGSLPQVGRMGLQAGEKLQVNEQGALVSITLGSLKGDTTQPGDPMAFANLPASMTVDKDFARLNGALARLSGGNLALALEVAPSGVFLLRDGGQVFQLLPTLPITIDATLADGISVTPLGLLRWVRNGVVVQFAPAVADLAGLASAVTAALPGATLKLGAEGVLQLRTGGRTYVLKPDWTGAGTATGTPRIGVDAQGRIVFQIGQGASQLLLPALLNTTQAQAIFQAAIPGSTLAVQPASDDGAFTVTLAGQPWRLVPQRVLPEGQAAQVPAPAASWWMGADGVLYLKLGAQVQGVSVRD